MGLILVVLMVAFLDEADRTCRHPWVRDGGYLLLHDCRPELGRELERRL